MRTQLRLPLAAIAALSLLVPAQPAQEKRGTVSGKVFYKGKPLPAGIIGFFSKEGAKKTTLNDDGSYQFRLLSPGKYHVTISTEVYKKDGAPKYVPLPKKYADRRTTPLTLEVKPGKQTHDIKLD